MDDKRTAVLGSSLSKEIEFIRSEEDALFEFQYLLFDLMRERGITKAELAGRLGISRARMSQIFSSEANPTLKTTARCLVALGYQIKLGKAELPYRDQAKKNEKKAVAAVQELMRACISEDWSGSNSPHGNNENFAPEKQVA